MRTHSDQDDADRLNEGRSDEERDTTAARVTIRAALGRYARAQNAAEAQLSVLAMHEGLRQALRAWLLYQAHLSDRQREAIQDPYTRFGELLDLAVHHTRLFEGRRALWHDELNVLLDHRNAIAHPVEEMDGDTALAAKVEQAFREAAAVTYRGIFRVVSRAELDDLGAYPEAAFFIEPAEGYYVSDGVQDDSVLVGATRFGAHGFLPTETRMHTGFIAAGAGIRRGVPLPLLRQIDVAPTIARLLGFTMPDVDGVPIVGVLK